MNPQITVALPSYNQGRFLPDALNSLATQSIPLEIFLADGGSTDNSLQVIENHKDLLAGHRSHPDRGQSDAINESIARGTAPYVCWLNSDDWLLPEGLSTLIQCLEKHPEAPAAYGRALNHNQRSGKETPVWVEPFSERRLATRCIISQPATLIRRSAWEAIGGLNQDLHMAMDYDLWWRLFQWGGPLAFVDDFVAVNREHEATKTHRNRRLHYQEAMAVVSKYHGRLPWKWVLYRPYAVWWKAICGRAR